MKNEHVLSGLVRKRGELAGKSVALKARFDQINADLAHVDVSILLFDPEYDLSAIRPKRGHGLAVARPGEMSRFVLTVLREAGKPMPTPTIVAKLLAERGLDARDRAVVRNVTKRVGMTLRHQEQHGMVLSEAGTGDLDGWLCGGWHASTSLRAKGRCGRTSGSGATCDEGWCRRSPTWP